MPRRAGLIALGCVLAACTSSKDVVRPVPGGGGKGTAAPRCAPAPEKAVITGSPGAWRLKYAPGCGPAAEAGIVVAEKSFQPKVLGATGIGSTTYVFVLTDAGASTQFADLYAYGAGTLAPVMFGADPFRVAFGGSVTHGNGVRCEVEQIVNLSAASSDGKTWVVNEDTFTLVGSVASLKTTGTERTIVDETGAQVAQYYTITCEGVVSVSD